MTDMISAAQTLSWVQILVLIVLMLVSGGGLVELVKVIFKRITEKEQGKQGAQQIIDQRSVSMMESFTDRQSLEIDRLIKDKDILHDRIKSLESELDVYEGGIFRSLSGVYNTKSLLEILVQQMSSREIRNHETLLLRVDQEINQSAQEMEVLRATAIRVKVEPGFTVDIPNASDAESTIRRAIGDVESEVVEMSEAHHLGKDTSSSSSP